MAKKKDEAQAKELQTESQLNLQTENILDVIIANVDFNELLEIENAFKQTVDQFDKISGNIERLKYDLDFYHNRELDLNRQVEAKRKELIKRYQIDETRRWHIDYATHKVIYLS